MQDARCIFAIHNLSHQGVEPADTFANFGLPDSWSGPSSAEPLDTSFPVLKTSHV